MTLDSFDAMLVEQKKETSNNTLLIKADIAAKHGDVLQIMRLAREVQMETFALAVDTEIEE